MTLFADLPAPVVEAPTPRFRVRSDEDLAPSGTRAKVTANLAAIHTLAAIEAGDRTATPDEQAVLARWAGWGALPWVFDERDERFDNVRQELLGLLSPEDYAAARASTPNAHYTSYEVASAIWDTLAGLGFETGRVLEPGCGAGVFLGTAPDGAEMVGVELEPTTARIAGTIYPAADVRACGFESVRDPDAGFAAVVGNVPFGNYPVRDPAYNRRGHSIHNYFLAKAARLVAPGGVVAVVTSRYWLDAASTLARAEVAEHCDLLGAVRLPRGAFARVAGTDVVADVVVLRRRLPDEEPADPSWVETTEVSVDGELHRISSYFAAHLDRVLGRLSTASRQYGAEELTVIARDQDLGAVLGYALGQVVAGTRAACFPVGSQVAPAPAPVGIPAPLSAKEGSFHLHDGQVFGVRAGRMVPHAIKPAKDAAEMTALIGLRDAAQAVLDAQADGVPWETAQQALREAYDAYVVRWGFLNRFTWQRHGTNATTGDDACHKRFPAMGGFRSDPDWPLVAALERFDDDAHTATLAAIFTTRVVGGRPGPGRVDSVHDALSVVLDDVGGVDMAAVAALAGVGTDEAIAALGDKVYLDPATGTWELADIYLAGNLRAKADQARVAGPAYARNVEALEAALPEPISPGEISVRPGAPWIPAEVVQDFMREVLNVRWGSVTHVPELAKWSFDVRNWARTGVACVSEYGTHRADAVRLLELACNGKMPNVYDNLGPGERVFNPNETLAAREKQEALVARFGAWIWEDDERAIDLAERYNVLYNSHVAARFDGSHLSFPGMSPAFTPHPHQRDAIWRIICSPTTLLSHPVGSGKTAIMAAAGLELRRLGIVSKPAYVVPGHLLEQFARELVQLYPRAKVLIAGRDDASAAKRKAFVARCATRDWDAVVMTHSTFSRIPVSATTRARYLQRQIDSYRAAATGSDSPKSVKELEKAIHRLEARHAALANAEAKDDGVDFEKTGIDFLAGVDEAHLFKNLGFASSTRGIGANGSQRAEDLATKVNWLFEQGRPRVAVFATATPIANSVAEMYVMQRYLQPDTLAEVGIDAFDAWKASFGREITALELGPDGHTYRMSTRFAGFANVPELLRLFRLVADVVTPGDLDLPLPEVEGGKAYPVAADASPALEAFVAGLVDRAERIRSRQVRPEEDNMLAVTTDGRKAALHLGLVGQSPDPSGGKVAACAERVAEIHHAGADRRFTGSDRRGVFQMVFCDLGTPKGPGHWSVYQELKDRMVAGGVPADGIRFIHEARSDLDKINLFTACRDGRVAVLVGSTEKMGLGTNAHTRLAALHHLDAPWRPCDVEQRDGRAIRQGNECPEVALYRYVTRSSFDTYVWAALERKSRFVHQVMAGDVGREVGEVDDTVLSYAELKAISSGDPRVIAHAERSAQVARLRRSATAHERDRARMAALAVRHNAEATLRDRHAARLTALVAERVPTAGDAFAITIEGTAFTTWADAGKALVAALTTRITGMTYANREVRTDPVATLGGMTVSLRYGPHRAEQAAVVIPDVASIPVSGHRPDRENPVGLIRRIETAITNMDSNIAADLAEADRLRAEGARAVRASHRDFPHAGELAAAEMALAALEAELAGDQVARGDEGEAA
ncbi:MAG: helicase [Acidimicrobiales bacterium]